MCISIGQASLPFKLTIRLLMSQVLNHQQLLSDAIAASALPAMWIFCLKHRAQPSKPFISDQSACLPFVIFNHCPWQDDCSQGLMMAVWSLRYQVLLYVCALEVMCRRYVSRGLFAILTQLSKWQTKSCWRHEKKSQMTGQFVVQNVVSIVGFAWGNEDLLHEKEAFHTCVTGEYSDCSYACANQIFCTADDSRAL